MGPIPNFGVPVPPARTPSTPKRNDSEYWIQLFFVSTMWNVAKSLCEVWIGRVFVSRLRRKFPRMGCAIAANFMTLTREKREFPMQRLLMPATTLTTLRKIAFTLLCCTVLMVFGASAQNLKADPGANNGPPAGTIILDLGGAYATPPTSALPITGNGNQTYNTYTANFNATLTSTVITFAFRDDPAQISFTNASVVDNATPSLNLLTNGNFAEGLTGWTYVDTYGVTGAGTVASGSGACYAASYCWFDGAVQAYDAISQSISTTAGHTYKISFDVAEDSGIFSVPVPNGNSEFPVGYPGSNCYLAINESGSPCYFSDQSTNTDACGLTQACNAGGNGINVVVYAQSSVPPDNYTLSLTEQGLGAGTVQDTSNSSSQPSPIYCTETGAGAAQTGTCSESDASGTTVTLTATPGSTAAGQSTFGGWGPPTGPCAYAGTSTTCTVMLNASQTVTASFIAPPVTQSLQGNYCSALGSQNTASTTYCPNGVYSNNVCQDPNGVVFTVEIPVLNLPTGDCISLQATATEVTGTGVCPASQVPHYGEGFPNSPTTDFDCRFVSFYNYGTTAAGVQTPLCYPYFNGNCVYYTLQLDDNQGPIPATETPAGVIWQVNINPSNAPLPPADQFTPPTGYAPLPRMLLDPSEDEAAPLPWGNNCTTPMNMEALSGAADPFSLTGYSTPYTNLAGSFVYCQFDTDITTFFSGTVGGDAPTAGGKSGGSSDIVLAFEPTTLGTGSTAPSPAGVAPNIVLDCDTGCTPTGAVPSTITFTEGTPGTAVVTETVSANPTPTLAISMPSNTTAVSAMESGYTVTLTTSGSFGSQFVVAPNVYIIVDGCAAAAYDGAYLIAGGGSAQNTLTYTNSVKGLSADSCMVTALPAGLTFNLNTGVLSGTPGLGSAGSYPVTFTASNLNASIPNTGTSSPSYTLVVNSATATVTLTNMTQTYTGSQLTPTVTTNPPGLNIVWTNAPQTNVGSYAVTATINDPNYIGSANGTFMINPATATVTLTNMTQTYTGSALSPTVTTTPTGLSISLTGAPDTNAGGYPVTATITNPNYTGSASGTFTINKATATVALSNLTQTYTGSPLTPTATTSPAGLTIVWTGAPDTNVGSYAVTATVSNANYQDSASGTFTITPTLTVSPTSLIFQTTTTPLYPGQSGIPQFLIVKNPEPTPVVISSVAIGGTNSNYFGDLAFCMKLPATLPAGAECLIAVDAWMVPAPAATSASPFVATAYLAINIQGGSAIETALTTYVINPVASFNASGLSSGKLTFPTTPKGSSKTVSITVTNTGTTPLILATPAISGVSLPFSASTTCSGATVQPNGTCVINVTFAPTAKGTFTGTLKVTDNAHNRPQLISLSGTT